MSDQNEARALVALAAALLAGAASLACLVAYALDKSAAIRGRRRIPERTLLALGLVGGWPGALIAQRLFRHKTAKASFRAKFRVTVGLHLGVLAALLFWAR